MSVDILIQFSVIQIWNPHSVVQDEGKGALLSFLLKGVSQCVYMTLKKTE